MCVCVCVRIIYNIITTYLDRLFLCVCVKCFVSCRAVPFLCFDFLSQCDNKRKKDDGDDEEEEEEQDDNDYTRYELKKKD